MFLNSFNLLLHISLLIEVLFDLFLVDLLLNLGLLFVVEVLPVAIENLVWTIDREKSPFAASVLLVQKEESELVVGVFGLEVSSDAILLPAHLTDGALKGLLVAVNAHVALEVVVVVEALATNLTLELVLCRVLIPIVPALSLPHVFAYVQLHARNKWTF